MKHHKLPPQKIAITHHGEVNKTFIIGAVSILAIILLGIFLFFQSNLAGKAVFPASTSADAPSLDITMSDDGLNLFVSVNNPESKVINALYFELANDALCGLDEDDPTLLVPTALISNQLHGTTDDWDQFEESGCFENEDGNLVFFFGAASVTPENFRDDDPIDVLTLTFDEELESPLNIALSNVAVYDADAVDVVDPDAVDETNLFATAVSSTISVTRPQVVVVQQTVSTPQTAPSAPANNNNNGGGGGGFTCVKQWACDDWSACLNNQQTRSCYDKKNCTTSVTVRGRSYPQVVVDRKGMPNTTQACVSPVVNMPASTPAQTSVQQQYAPVQTQNKPVQTAQPRTEKLSLAQVWTNYKSLFILGPVSLILFIVVLILFLHHFQHKKVAYNYDELKTWIAQEKKMGTSDDDIKQILSQNTGWKKAEVDGMFVDIGTTQIKK